MKYTIKLKNLIILCVVSIILFTVAFSAITVSAKTLELAKKEEKYQELLAVEREVVTIEEKKVIEVPKEVVSYAFPFDVEYLGEYAVKAVTKDDLPKKQYSNMRSKEGATIFANSTVFKEGTLLWVEHIGIVQVQNVYSDFDGLYVFFEEQSSVDNFDYTALKVYEVLE